MISATTRKQLGRCIAWGFVIEAPMLWWLISVQNRLHSLILPALAAFHMFSLYLSYAILWPFHKRMSESTANWIGFPMIGIFNAILIGCALFMFRFKSGRQPEPED